MKVENKRFVTVETAAKIVGKTPGTLNNDRFLHKGLPYIKNGGLIRYELSDLIAYMQDHKIYPEGRPKSES